MAARALGATIRIVRPRAAGTPLDVGAVRSTLADGTIAVVVRVNGDEPIGDRAVFLQRTQGTWASPAAIRANGRVVGQVIEM